MRQADNRDNNLVTDIAVILLGLLILLGGMTIVNGVVTGALASFIDIIPMTISLWFVSRFLHIDRLIGKKGVFTFLFLLFIITIVILVYSLFFVFSDNGYFFTLDKTGIFNEHAWCHDSIVEISKHSFRDILHGGIDNLYLGKYRDLFVYCSLMIRCGGDVLTNMCVWRAFHLGIVVLLMMKIAARIGVVDCRSLRFIMVFCLFMPMMDTLFAYNHDCVGYAFVALGSYIFVCCYRDSALSLFAFPFFFILLYIFRQPYALIAVAMYLWSLFFGGQKTSSIIVGLFAVALLIVVISMTVDIPSMLAESMQMDVHMEALSESQSQRGVINGLIVSILGYFPWTNLLHDVNWPYSVFNCFQGAMDLALLFYVVRVYQSSLIRSFVSNPILLLGLLFLISSFVYPGHLSYTSVAMPFFVIAVSDEGVSKFARDYGITIIILFVAGIIWSWIR